MLQLLVQTLLPVAILGDAANVQDLQNSIFERSKTKSQRSEISGH